MLRRDESRHDFAFLAGVVVGALSGALTTLALTPMSGSETREKLRARASTFEPVKERATSVVTTGKEKVTDLAAKTPLPIGRQDTDGGTSMGNRVESEGFGEHGAHTEQPAEGAVNPVPKQDRQGFGVHGAHTQEPAEGERDASTRATPAAHEEIKGPADQSSQS